MTKVQHELIKHALGTNTRKNPHRNCLATGEGEDTFKDVSSLVDDGYMAQGGTIPGGLTYYHATAAGIAAAKLTFEEFVALLSVVEGDEDV